mgnify:CR=1 FL=1
MKVLSTLTLAVLFSGAAYSSSGENIYIAKLEKNIAALKATKSHITVNVSNLVQADAGNTTIEANTLWPKINGAYDFLRTLSIGERFAFIYEGAKAYSVSQKERASALTKWINEQDKLISKRIINKTNLREWKTHSTAIQDSISEINKGTPTRTAAVVPEIRPNQAHQALLSAIETDLKGLKASLAAPVAAKTAEPAPQIEAAPAFPEITFEFDYRIIAGASLTLLAAAFLASRKKTKKTQKVKTKTTKATVQAVQKKTATTAIVAKTATATVNAQPRTGINFEEECSKAINDSTHILDMAQMKVIPAARSPFKTTLNISQEKASEAIELLLKGVIAISNTNGGKASHMEWGCTESNGRVYVDFTLHGIECDYKSLYLNTVLEKTSSAPAYFGRTEMLLDGHLPSVHLKSGKNKTTVSLGIESHAASLTH